MPYTSHGCRRVCGKQKAAEWSSDLEPKYDKEVQQSRKLDT